MDEERRWGKRCITLTLTMHLCLCLAVTSHPVQRASESNLLGSSQGSVIFYVILVRDPVSPCLNKMGILIHHRIVLRTIRWGADPSVRQSLLITTKYLPKGTIPNPNPRISVPSDVSAALFLLLWANVYAAQASLQVNDPCQRQSLETSGEGHHRRLDCMGRACHSPWLNTYTLAPSFFESRRHFYRFT